MVFRVTSELRRVIHAIAVAAALTAATAYAQSTYQQPVAGAAPIAPESVSQEVARVLSRGGELEAQNRWADALTLYEEAVRANPGEDQLKRRFEVARLHFGIERRYADASFTSAIRELDNTTSSRLYSELLQKIESHYVVTPPWQKIASRGAASVQLAVSKNVVRRQNGIRASTAQIAQVRREIRDALVSTPTMTTRADVLRFENTVARIAASRLGLSPVATALEFTAAATCALDNYSAFLTPDQLRDVYSQIEGNFVGLGVELKGDRGALLIVRVIPGSPAAKAGIVDGDRIVAVDGQATADLSTDDAAGLLTGEEGSICRVTIVPAGAAPGAQTVAKPIDGLAPAGATRELVVRRAHVDVPSLEGVKIVDPQYGVAYIRIPVFQKSTSRDLDTALWDLHRQGMRSLILDLRGNPGGLLTSSVELADKFVSQGGIVSTRGRSDGEDFDYRAHRAGTWRVPLVVLIDGDSASASEIFAAAIRDNRRGTIIGVRSFGKGSVQGIFPLGYGGAGIRLTTAKFFSPNGQPISEVGVSPDIVVRHATSSANGQKVTVGFRGAESDEVLTRAIDTARHQMAMR